VSEEYLTEAEVAAMLRVPAETVRYWRWAGTGPRAFKVGRRVLYARADFDAFSPSGARRPARERGRPAPPHGGDGASRDDHRGNDIITRLSPWSSWPAYASPWCSTRSRMTPAGRTRGFGSPRLDHDGAGLPLRRKADRA
jgi:hypothetical protein